MRSSIAQPRRPSRVRRAMTGVAARAATGFRWLLAGWVESTPSAPPRRPAMASLVVRAVVPVVGSDPRPHQRSRMARAGIVAGLAGLVAMTPVAGRVPVVAVDPSTPEGRGSLPASPVPLGAAAQSALINATAAWVAPRGALDLAFDQFATLDAPLLTSGTDTTGQRPALRYRTVRGDALSTIANRHGVSLMTLWWANRMLDASTLAVGQLVRVLPTTGIRHVVGDGDTIDSIARDYDADVAAIAAYNGLQDGIVILGQHLIVPDGRGGPYRPTPDVSWSTSLPRLRPGQADRAAETRAALVTLVGVPVPAAPSPPSPEAPPEAPPQAPPDATPDDPSVAPPDTTPTETSPEALGVKRTAGVDAPSTGAGVGAEPSRARVTPSVRPSAMAGPSGAAPWWRRLYARVVGYLYEPTGGNDGPDIRPEPPSDTPAPPPPTGDRPPGGNGRVVIVIPPDAPVPRGPGGHRSWPDGPPPVGITRGRVLEVDDPRLTLTARQALRHPLLWPVYGGGILSQLFHGDHMAIDISAPKGTPLLAPYSGIMVFRHYRDDRCANAVWIKHGPRFFTSYCHLWRFSDVRRGDWVEKGEVIGYIGTGGYSTGPHVHFGVSIGPRADLYAYRRDPLLFVRRR